MGQLRRCRVLFAALAAIASLTAAGCRGLQLIRFDSTDSAAEALFRADEAALGPVVEDAVASLLARHVPAPVLQASFDGDDLVPPPPKRICVVPHDDAERSGILEPVVGILDRRIAASNMFAPVDRALVDAALREARLEPAALVVPENRKTFSALLEQQGQPVDYLLFATLTSDPDTPPPAGGPALLMLELIDARSGSYDQQPIDVTQILRARPWWGRR